MRLLELNLVASHLTVKENINLHTYNYTVISEYSCHQFHVLYFAELIDGEFQVNAWVRICYS